MLSYTKHIPTIIGLFAVILCAVCIDYTSAQENAQLNIPPSLIECYNTSYFMNRENRLPSNMETLITLIEKVENSYGFSQDIRQLAVSLLHRFRQDGIQRAPGVTSSPGVIPYSPTGFQFPKFRILLSRLIPGNAYNFPNSSLTREERCSMHFMLSSSFDTRVRGDENQVCSKLSQYRAQRLPRALQQRTNFMGDVELLETIQTKVKSRTAPQMRANLDQDFGTLDVDYGYGSSNENAISQCPVENGVVWTQWGTVAAGTLIAGIAAGLQPQSVQLRTLLQLASRGPGRTSPQIATVNIDNRWAATIAGDLAEVALVQVPVTTTETASVGANGAWNSTALPRWYFLSQRQNLEMTDAEIRGGLDGLIIAMNISQWRTQAPNMKLSQLLRMYYSMDGVLGSGIMACNRKTQFPTIAPTETMAVQTSAFAQVLDREMQLRVTLSPTAIGTFSTSAAQALTSYVPASLNDVSCSVSSQVPQDISETITAMTNLYVFLDTSWQYNDVAPYINYVLQRLNINPYASNVTILNAADGKIIVNTTNYITDVSEQWNITTQSYYTPGFNLPTILNTIQNITQNLLNVERTNNSVGGRSLVSLLVPNTANINDGDSNYATTQIQYLSEQVPDLRFIYYGGGSVSRFSAFVGDPSQDVFQLTLGSTVSASANPVAQRIKKIPRRIINPRCGSNWYTNTWGTDQLAQYARPGITNFYRLAPNYFFGGGSGRYLTVTGQSSVQFTVCGSRTSPTNLTNTNIIGSTTTSGDQNCVQIGSGTSTYTYDLNSACNGYQTIHQCPPLYVTVQAPENSGSGLTNTVSCNDAACQTPDQIKFIISVTNLGCYSGVATIVASFGIITFAYLLLTFLQ